MFPQSAAQLRNPVVLEANQWVQWQINGKRVGEGQTWQGWLSPSMYEVMAINNDASQTISINVQEDFPLHQPVSVNSLVSEGKLSLPEGHFRVLLGNLAAEKGVSNTTQKDWVQILYERTNNLLKANRLKVATKRVSSLKYEENRTFQMISLENSSILQIKAQKLFSGQNTLVYVDEATPIEFMSIILEISQDFDSRTVFLVKKLFGETSDVDGNNKTILLFSPKLNQSKRAVGFFYAGDLLKRDSGVPESNEAEILYLGTPSTQDANFSASSLRATACHEFQHLIQFSEKTLPYLDSLNPPIEELSVSEGLAHLAEDLCGFNLKGGNLVFASRYLQKAPQVSLDGISLSGQSDSVERRGAMYLFLRYLFEQQGGINFEKDEINDLGGARFLKTITVSD